MGRGPESLGGPRRIVPVPLGDEGLKAALKRDLPNFMQPHVVRWVETMPVNPNGKIDRTALQAELAA